MYAKVAVHLGLPKNNEKKTIIIHRILEPDKYMMNSCKLQIILIELI